MPSETPDSGPRVTVYWLEKSRSQRIVWLLEELNVSYELKTYKRGEDNKAGPESKEIHPLGKYPVVAINKPSGSGSPLILAESGAIVEYLIDHFGEHMVPQKYVDGKDGEVGGETESWLRNRYFIHYTEGSFMPFLVLKIVVDRIRNAPVPFFIKPLTRMIAENLGSNFVFPSVTTHLNFLEDQVKSSPEGGDYFCGKQLTGSDIMLSFPLEAVSAAGIIPKDKYPALNEYLDRIRERTAYKKAVAKIVETEGEYVVAP